MNSAADDIASFIHSSGIALIGTNLFVGHEPTDPDTCITVYDYPGGTPDTDEMDVRLPNFQIRTRSSDYDAAYQLQERVYTALTSSRTGIITETSVFSLIVLNTDIASLGRDGNQRTILVASYRARRTQKEI